jgi:hypothetical protein
MKKLSAATPADFDMLKSATAKLADCGTLQSVAQAFVENVYTHFQESLVLLRLFSSVPYSALPLCEKQFLDKKSLDSGSFHLFRPDTPVLTLLGTRGQREEWNDRSNSQSFRCIPLLSSRYVETLPMLSMQLRKMNFELRLLDTWESTVLAQGRADEYTGTLHVRDAAVDQDAQGRMVVPRQDFVSGNGVKTALGFGAGYRNHPTIITLFAFTNETVEESAVENFSVLLQSYLSVSEHALTKGSLFC